MLGQITDRTIDTALKRLRKGDHMETIKSQYIENEFTDPKIRNFMSSYYEGRMNKEFLVYNLERMRPEKEQQ